MKQHYEDPIVYNTEAFPYIKGIGIILHNTTCNPYHVHHLNILSMIRIGIIRKIRSTLVLSSIKYTVNNALVTLIFNIPCVSMNSQPICVNIGTLTIPEIYWDEKSLLSCAEYENLETGRNFSLGYKNETYHSFDRICFWSLKHAVKNYIRFWPFVLRITI